jgi:integrase
MSVMRKRDSRYYYYDFRRGGIRFQGSTRRTTEREAKKVEDALIASVEAEQASGPIKQSVKLNYACGHYYERKAKWNRSAETVDYQLDNLIRIIGKDTKLEQIDDGKVGDFVARRRGEAHRKYRNPKTAPRVSPSTVNRETELLKSVLRYAAKKLKAKVAEIESWSDLMLVEPTPPDRPLSDEQEDKLFAELIPHAAKVCDVALLVSHRRGAVLSLDWMEVKLQEGFVTFLVSRKNKPAVRDRKPINPAMRAILMSLGPKNEGPVFVYGDYCGCSYCKRHAGEPIKSVRTAFEGAVKRAGIKKFRFHDLRHTALTRITKAYGIHAANGYAQHADINSTMRYAHYDKKGEREMMDAISRSSTEVRGQKIA